MSQPIELEIYEDEVFLPCYQHLHQPNDIDIELLWGSRDSGKSTDIAGELILKCLESDYFRCILIKKTFRSVKDAQWQTIKDTCREWGIMEMFSFTVSPLEITCKLNGNKFLTRGCDDVENLKSISNPSHAWIEEANQLEESDYITIATTLRSNTGRVKQYLSFNPECKGNYEDFWLYKNYMAEFYTKGVLSFTSSISIKLDDGTVATRKYRSTHTTYKNNPYCSSERVAMYESLKSSSPYYYQVYALGMWGHPEVKNPFLIAINPAKHFTLNPVYDSQKQLYISLDFNIDPFAFTFGHRWRDSTGLHHHTFDEATIYHGSIPKAIEYINDMYGPSLPMCKITGDASGNRRSIENRDNAGLFTQLQTGLRVRPQQIIVPSNPTHKTSRADCNYFLMNFEDFQVNKDKCPNLCFDMQHVEVDETGHIIKEKREKDEQRADHLDCFRADINTFEKEWIEKHRVSSQKRPK